MGNGHAAGVARGFRTLWGSGAVGGLTDGQLIARFVERRDDRGEAAFEVMVERHGPMVLRVARDVLRDPHSAQDAFQATFLVLARKASSIARPEALAPWLYGVAHRVARKARVESDRRRRHEARAAERASDVVEAEADRTDFDFGPTLHDEVDRLPGPCRVAVVLCYFEGLTYEQAAGRLGVTEAAVRGRLARARRQLRRRLSGMGAASWSLPSVPGRWIGPTARAASRFARGLKEAAPAPVVGLAEGVSRTMCYSQLKAAAVLVAFHLLAVAGVLARQEPAIELPPGPPAQGKPAPRAEIPEMTRRPEGPDAPEPPARLELTLDQAIGRLLVEDQDLRSKFSEIPRARADVLTRDLRQARSNVSVSSGRGKNAFVTLGRGVGVARLDSRFAPVDEDDAIRPGGKTQADVNVSNFLDLAKKRATRTPSPARGAVLPTTLLEAQYIDAARMRIDRLATAFGEALAARDLARLRSESAERLDGLAESARERGEDPAGIRGLDAARDASAVGRDQEREALIRSSRAVARLLSVDEGTELEVVGELGREPGVPTLDSLIDQALAARPDLLAYRLGLARAKDDVKLAYSSYVLVQPYVFDHTQAGSQGPISWAQAFTSPMLDFAVGSNDHRSSSSIDDPRRANLRRSKLNVGQAQVELASLESQIISEVQQAYRECQAYREAVVEAVEKATAATYALDTARARYRKGTQDLAALLDASRNADEAARLRVEVLARQYQSRAALNTALGRRVVQP